LDAAGPLYTLDGSWPAAIPRPGKLKNDRRVLEACFKAAAHHQSSPVVLASLIHPANNPPMGVAEPNKMQMSLDLFRISHG